MGDIDNIQRHARMDRYVAQATPSSQNVSIPSILQIQTQIEKSGFFSGHPLLPSLLITEKLYLPSPPSSVQKKSIVIHLPHFLPFFSKKGPFHPPILTPSILQRCKDLRKRDLRRRSLGSSRRTIADERKNVCVGGR